MIPSNKEVVLVTGCSTGLGRVSAETLARDGYRVFASMRGPDDRNLAARSELEELAATEGLTLRVLQLDVTSDDSVQRAVAEVLETEGRIDVVVNNAGTMPVGITEGYTLDQVQRAFDVNVYGSMRLNRAALPHMRRQESGLLVQVTSLAARVVFPFFAIYCATKFAADAMAEGYRYELSMFGIDSVIVQPGPYPSNLIATSADPDDDERLGSYGEIAAQPRQLLGRFREFFASAEAPDPREVADVIGDLIRMPAGHRPVRTVAGIDYGVRRLNREAAPIQHDLLQGLGLAYLEPLENPAAAPAGSASP